MRVRQRVQRPRRVGTRILPEEKMQSFSSRSSIVVVPTAEPIASSSPTDVLSWHMFELSGRLFVPFSRAVSAHI